MAAMTRSMGNLFSVRNFTRTSPKEFEAIVDIGELVDQKAKLVRVSHRTNAGMGEFLIESR
jgi:hypothetical protein